ncbi:hypothetical protein MTR67_034781, partial [Solanum verrucosum]
TLVRIANQLGDLPFSIVHRHFAPSFDIIVLWVIGRHSSSSKNFSAMPRLLFFSRTGSFTSRLSTLEQKEK